MLCVYFSAVCVCEVHTCTLTAPGLGGTSSGLSLERLWCMGSPVLLTADSLVGLLWNDFKNTHMHKIKKTDKKNSLYSQYKVFCLIFLRLKVFLFFYFNGQDLSAFVRISHQGLLFLVFFQKSNRYI